MTNKKKTRIGTLMFLICLCILCGTVYLVKVWNYQETVKHLTYSDLALGTIKNGTYIGDYNVDFIYAKVAVTVKDGVITQIDILQHKNERGTAAETITDGIVQQQSLNVDAITGATNSSKVIKKAVEIALTKPGN